MKPVLAAMVEVTGQFARTASDGAPPCKRAAATVSRGSTDLSIRETIVGRVIEAGGKLTVRSALNPILWLCAIISFPSVVAALLVRPAPVWLIVLACAPVG